MIGEVEAEWLSGRERRCPLCGEKLDVAEKEDEDWFEVGKHWLFREFECFKCGGRFAAEYELKPVLVYEMEDRKGE